MSADPPAESRAEPLAPALPRAKTFRNPRPASTGPGGLRRGATFLPRPQSLSSTTPLSPEPEPTPRLRRGSSFAGRSSPSNQHDGVPTLRRASRRAPPPSAARPRDTAVEPPAPRHHARREALASQGKGLEEKRVVGQAAESASFEEEAAKEECGMCSACRSGVEGMPPWAPERLKKMSAEERLAVFLELQRKEEAGKIEAKARGRRMREMTEVNTRLDARRGPERLVGTAEELGGSANTEAHLKAYAQLEVHGAKAVKERGAGVEDEEETIVEEGAKIAGESFDELESVDLGTETRSSKSGSRRRGRSDSRSGSRGESRNGSSDTWGSGEFANIRTANARESGKARAARRRLEEDCAQCGDLDVRVKDLEEQLAVLREVVAMCEAGEGEGEGKKPKTWKDRVMSAYWGGGGKGKLREEVEALRKATDFLFQKLQKGGDSQGFGFGGK